MALSTKDFWRLLVESRLANAAQCQKLFERSTQVKDTASRDDANELAEWLVAQRALTRYQAKVLLSGRAGPFVYGPYQLRDRVTTGRLNGCFRGVHIATRHPVLLWFFSGPVLQNPDSYATAIGQVAAACQAVHPCLCQTYQLADAGKYKFVVLENLIGTTAEDMLASRKRAAPAEACRLMRQVALGLAALHANGQPHSDIRPQNIWIDAQGNGRLLQIPLSREPHRPLSSPLEPKLSEEERSRIADYSAPELGFQPHIPDALSDIYAIGSTLYHLLSGSPPFAGGDAATKLRRHATEAIQPLEPLGVPAALAKVVAYAMAKDRKLRYQTAAQLAEALAYFVEPQQKQIMPQPAATYRAYEAWRQTHPPVPQVPPAPLHPGGADVRPKTAATTIAAAHGPDRGHVGETATGQAAALISSPAAVQINPLQAGAALAHSQTAQMAPSDQALTDSFATTNGAGELTFLTAQPEANSATAMIRQRKKRARNNALFTMALIVALGVGAGIGYLMYDRDLSPAIGPQGDATSDSSATDTGADEAAQLIPNDKAGDTANNSTAQAGKANLIANDGRTLWASPTAGEAISWAYLPARAHVVLAIRPADFFHHPEAEKLLAALGPHGKVARTAAEKAIGIPLAEIDQLTVAWTKSDGGWTATYVVRPAATTTPEALAAKWQSFQPMEQGVEKYFISEHRAYFAPAAEQGKLFVVSSPEQMPEVAAGGSASPLLREMVKLVQTSDRERLCTVLFTTDALLTEAQSAFSAAGAERLHDAMVWLIQDNSKAAALSLHLGETCYMEARLVGNAQTTTPRELADAMRERTKRLALDVEDYLSRIELHPYGRRILIGLGSMTRFVQQQIRVDAEDDQVVLNCYLPAIAAHNLAMAIELLTFRPANGTAPLAIQSSQARSDTPSTVAERLKKPITFVQQLDTLENAAKALSTEISIPIEVLGMDFQSESITRNNQFAFEAKDKPADELLRELLLKANPDGKLVYVIKPKSAGGEEMIFITTRTAAARRGDTLPGEFAAQPNAKKVKAAKPK